MLLTQARFKGFSDAPIPDAKTSTGLMLALQLDDREAVDVFAKTALANGGGEPRPATDMGFMYNRTISDLDGHRWEPFFMDMTQMPKS
jgi:predicted lactoylglutathione lyase